MIVIFKCVKNNSENKLSPLSFYSKSTKKREKYSVRKTNDCRNKSTNKFRRTID